MEARAVRFILPAAVAVLVLAFAVPSLMRRAAPAAPAPAPAVATAKAEPAPPDETPGRAVIDADGAGHYRTQATVDGRLLDMIVDTGASAVVLRYEDAERLGLADASSRFDVPVETANGRAAAARVTLGSVAIGGITLYDVPALVAPPGALGENLLGMSALKRLNRIEAREGQLVLEN
jgi:aspartyl protease family protein